MAFGYKAECVVVTAVSFVVDADQIDVIGLTSIMLGVKPLKSK